ncbi:hypothetical protein [Dyella jiangningensis]
MKRPSIVLLCLTALSLPSFAPAAPSPPAGHVTGVGGIFFKAKDPKALAA